MVGQITGQADIVPTEKLPDGQTPEVDKDFKEATPEQQKSHAKIKAVMVEKTINYSDAADIVLGGK